MGPPLLKIHHPLDNVSPGAKVMRRGDPFSIESILRLYGIEWSMAARVCPSTLARASAWSQARWAQINRTMRSLWSVGRDVSWCVHLQEKAVRPSTRKHGTSFLIDSICEGHKVKRHLMNGNWMFSCKCSSITFVCRLSPEVSERICPCHLNISVFTPMEKGDRLFKCNKSKSCSNLRLR